MRTWPCSLLAAAALACGGGGSSDDPDGSPAPDARVDASTLPDGPGLAGKFRDEDGDVIPNEQVLACMQETCFFGQSDETGLFFFELEIPSDVALKTPPAPSETPRRAAALCPIDIRDETLVVTDLLAVSMPPGPLFKSPAMDPQTLETGDGLELTLNRGDLTPRVGDSLVDAASRLLVGDQICASIAIDGEELLMVYALHPFAATSSTPIKVRAESDLPAGTQVFFRTISEIDGELTDPVTGMADGTYVATDDGLGIQDLTYLVISK